MFIVQGSDGHCRRHEDQLKLRSVPKLNRQCSLNHFAAIDSERHTTTDKQRYDNGFHEFDIQQPDEAANEELPVLVDQPVVLRRSTRVNFGIPPTRLIAEWQRTIWKGGLPCFHSMRSTLTCYCWTTL